MDFIQQAYRARIAQPEQGSNEVVVMAKKPSFCNRELIQIQLAAE